MRTGLSSSCAEAGTASRHARTSNDADARCLISPLLCPNGQGPLNHLKPANTKRVSAEANRFRLSFGRVFSREQRPVGLTPTVSRRRLARWTNALYKGPTV